MERHYTYFEKFFPGDLGANLEKFTVGVVIAICLILLAKLASSKIKTKEQIDNKIVPNGKFSLFDFFDVFVEGFVSFQDMILGKENRRYLSLCGSVFLFVFFSNLLGLVPGMPAITTTVWINVGLAIVVFIAFNYYGIREQGLKNYLKHFCGGDDLLTFSMIWLVPLIFFLEILSTSMRVLTLNLRLYWNIQADHLVLHNFSLMLEYLLPVPFYFLGFFVCFMQAFVFTVLTMIYILLAVQHEEEH